MVSHFDSYLLVHQRVLKVVRARVRDIEDKADMQPFQLLALCRVFLSTKIQILQDLGRRQVGKATRSHV